MYSKLKGTKLFSGISTSRQVAYKLSSESPDSFESAEAELAADGISDNRSGVTVSIGNTGLAVCSMAPDGPAALSEEIYIADVIV